MAIMIAIIPIMSIYFIIQDLSGHGNGIKTTVDFVVIGLTALSIQTFVFITRFKELKFRQTHTNLSNLQIENVLAKTANEHEWKIIDKGSNFIIAERDGVFGTGERITILFEDGLVLFNSICNPSRPSLSSFGYNKKNSLILEAVLSTASNNIHTPQI